jgi:hypothetical protein
LVPIQLLEPIPLQVLGVCLGLPTPLVLTSARVVQEEQFQGRELPVFLAVRVMGWEPPLVAGSD